MLPINNLPWCRSTQHWVFAWMAFCQAAVAASTTIGTLLDKFA